MNFKTKLLQRIQMDDIREITYHTQSSNQLKQELYDLLFDEDETVAYNAAWVMSHFTSNDTKWLCNKQNELIDELFICQHTGKRRLILTLLYRQPLAHPPRVDFLDFCLERMMSKEELTWTQALCMKLAYELCRTIPELCQELRTLLEMQETGLLTSSQRGVRENVLKAMKTGKSIQNFRIYRIDRMME